MLITIIGNHRSQDSPADFLYNDQPTQHLQIPHTFSSDTFESPRQSAWITLDVSAGSLLSIDVDEIPSMYATFYIPKKTGGMREINAPNSQLKNAMNIVKDYIQDTLCVLAHDAAHAYVKERSTITALKRHQENESRWFLKLDLKDFFPSHTTEYIMSQLEKIYPFAVWWQNQEIKQKWRSIIERCMLHGGLPQGSPLSPLLTNLCMVPIDYQIKNQTTGYIYTRYADDILISHKCQFDKNQMVNRIKRIMQEQNAPFIIKDEKTRYGSNAGRNWNLGTMLNKDNRITIGHKQNQRFRAAIFSFMNDLTTGNNWTIIDVQRLYGQISYYRMIDRAYTNHVLDAYSQKFNRNVEQAMKAVINGLI